MRALLILLLLTMPGLGLRAAEPAPASLVGDWSGPVEISETSPGLAGESIGMTLSGNAGGFSLRWTVPLVGTAEASFVATDRDGVYAVKTGGMFSMFSSGAAGNPLEGQQLLWARTDGPTLIVYSFEIAEAGAFSLARYECARDGDEVSVRYTRRTTDEGERLAVARLQPAGG
jgi:hypothetical protein